MAKRAWTRESLLEIAYQVYEEVTGEDVRPSPSSNGGNRNGTRVDRESNQRSNESGTNQEIGR